MAATTKPPSPALFEKPNAPKRRLVKPTAQEMEIMSPQGQRLTVKYMLITPELATKMLDANTKNRTPSDRMVDQYMRSMANGEWVFLGDTIRFADTGLLLDGQHRLMAIEESETAEWMLVIGGLPESVQRFIDIGRSRSSADQLKIDQVQHAAQLAAVANLLLQWAGWRAGNGSFTPAKHAITGFVHENVGILETARSYSSDVFEGCRKGISKPAVAAAYVRIAQVAGTTFAAAEFFTLVATGENIARGMPVYALRDSFLNQDRADRIGDLHKCVRCFNAHTIGETLTRYQPPAGGVSTGRFPDIIRSQAAGSDEEDA